MARAALFAATAGALAAPVLTQVRAKERAAWGQAGQQAPRRALADAALNSDRAGGLGAPCTCQTCLARARGGQGRRGLRRTKLAHQPKRPPGALRPPAPRPRSKPVFFSCFAPRWNPRAAAPLGAPPRGLPLATWFLAFLFLARAAPGARGAWRLGPPVRPPAAWRRPLRS